MAAPIRTTTALVKVLELFLTDPEADRYGLDVMRATGFPSGTVYPLLVRLQHAGWLGARWEEIDPVATGRPARHLYRLTPHGVRSAREHLAAHRQRRSKGTAVKPRPTWES